MNSGNLKAKTINCLLHNFNIHISNGFLIEKSSTMFGLRKVVVVSPRINYQKVEVVECRLRGVISMLDKFLLSGEVIGLERINIGKIGL